MPALTWKLLIVGLVMTALTACGDGSQASKDLWCQAEVATAAGDIVVDSPALGGCEDLEEAGKRSRGE